MIEGEKMYILSGGSMVGVATFGGVKVYATRSDFEADASLHMVTPITAVGSGTDYEDFMKIFQKPGKRLYGWILMDYRALQNPLASDSFVQALSLRMPSFSGQEHGQVFARTLMPEELDNVV